VIYDKARGSFVKQVTPGRFFGGFSLRQGRPEPVGDFRVDNGADGCRLRQGQAMGQQLQPWHSGKSRGTGKSWRSGNGERRWLSMLVDAMEEFSRPDIRSLPCHPSLLVAVRAQLARPASPSALGASRFSLRN
jgi:hypothetical protein